MVRLAFSRVVQDYPGQHRLLQDNQKDGLQDKCSHHGAQRHSARGGRRKGERGRWSFHGYRDLRGGLEQHYQPMRPSECWIFFFAKTKRERNRWACVVCVCERCSKSPSTAISCMSTWKTEWWLLPRTWRPWSENWLALVWSRTPAHCSTWPSTRRRLSRFWAPRRPSSERWRRSTTLQSMAWSIMPAWSVSLAPSSRARCRACWLPSVPWPFVSTPSARMSTMRWALSIVLCLKSVCRLLSREL